MVCCNMLLIDKKFNGFLYIFCCWAASSHIFGERYELRRIVFGTLELQSTSFPNEKGPKNFNGSRQIDPSLRF